MTRQRIAEAEAVLAGGLSAPELAPGGGGPELNSAGAEPEPTSAGEEPEPTSAGAEPELDSAGAEPEPTSADTGPEPTSVGPELGTARREGGRGAHRARVSWVGRTGQGGQTARRGWLHRMMHAVTDEPAPPPEPVTAGEISLGNLESVRTRPPRSRHSTQHREPVPLAAPASASRR